MAAAVMDAVVLAGGASRRMGRDKAMIVVDGERLVDRVIRLLAPLGGTVYVAAGRRSLGVSHEIPDAAGVAGPLGGLLGGLDAARSPYVAVVAVDMPTPNVEVLRRLAELCRRHDRPAAVPTADGRLQPLHAVVARASGGALHVLADAGERSPSRALARLDPLVAGPDAWADLDPEGSFSRDWDRPADLPPEVTSGR